MLSASFGVLSQNTGFYPSLDMIIETTLGPLNLGPRGGSYNEPISRLQRIEVGRGYHEGGSSWIFAKFSHCYGAHHANVYFPTASRFLLRVFQLPERDFSFCPINVQVVSGQPVIA